MVRASLRIKERIGNTIMTNDELIRELRHMAFIMNHLGDLRKATVLNQAAERLEQLDRERGNEDVKAN